MSKKVNLSLFESRLRGSEAYLTFLPNFFFYYFFENYNQSNK